MDDKSSQVQLIVSIGTAAIAGAFTSALIVFVMLGAATGGVMGPEYFWERFSQMNDAPAQTSADVTDERIVELIEEESATIKVVETVTPTVVNVVVKKHRDDLLNRDFQSDFFDPFSYPPREQLEQGKPLIEIGGGTGFFVSSDGLIVTNKHVVGDPDAIYSVVTNTGEELDADIVASDAFLDIAILDVEGDGYPVANLGDSEEVQIGQTVIAIGNSLSEFRNTVTKGVVSGMNRRIVAGGSFVASEVIEGAIQTDAAINPGNSGGPLINLLGKVVGVNTAISQEGDSIGFAIPINDVQKIVKDVQTHGRIVRPWLGVRYVVLTPDVAAEEALAYDYGAYITGSDSQPAVFSESPAANAGLEERDIILSVEGKRVDDTHSLAQMISQYEPGDTVRLRIARGDEELDASVTLAELDPEQIPSGRRAKSRRP